MQKKTTKFYLLKIALLHTKIPVWRKFYVPSDITLGKLHSAIQIIMGWTDTHMHEFKSGKLLFSSDDVCAEDDFGMTQPEKKQKLGSLLTKETQSFLYNYDMGDYWQHKITLENADYKKEEIYSVYCISGKGTCPPEDVGSVEGFEHFCDVINNPKDEEYAELFEWVHDFCGYPKSMKWPDGFDIEEVNDLLSDERSLNKKTANKE